jgi:hypothetical protein
VHVSAPFRANGAVVSILEAIYREDESERGWIDGILSAARPALDHGLGLTAYPFEDGGVIVDSMGHRRAVTSHHCSSRRRGGDAP